MKKNTLGNAVSNRIITYSSSSYVFICMVGIKSFAPANSPWWIWRLSVMAYIAESQCLPLIEFSARQCVYEAQSDARTGRSSEIDELQRTTSAAARWLWKTCSEYDTFIRAIVQLRQRCHQIKLETRKRS